MAKSENIESEQPDKMTIEEARRQCLLANASAHAKDDQAFIDSISWLNAEALAPPANHPPACPKTR